MQQAKVKLLQAPNKSNVDNLNDVRREPSRQRKKKGNTKTKIDELETNSKIIKY